MIDPNKLINKRMTDEDLSLLFLSGDVLMFKSKEQFESWLFVMNFPLLKKYLRLPNEPSTFNSTGTVVTATLDVPFVIAFHEDARVVQDNNGLDISVTVNREEVRYDLHEIHVNLSRPEARMIIRACR